MAAFIILNIPGLTYGDPAGTALKLPAFYLSLFRILCKLFPVLAFMIVVDKMSISIVKGICPPHCPLYL